MQSEETETDLIKRQLHAWISEESHSEDGTELFGRCMVTELRAIYSIVLR